LFTINFGLEMVLPLRNDHLTWRGGGGYVFFLKKYSDSQCCWKKYSDYGGEKKNNLIQSFCHITLNSGKKFRTLQHKKKYSNSYAVRKKKFWTKQKTITPPCKLNGRSLTMLPTLITKDSILSNFDPCRRHLLDLYTMYICRHGPLVQAIFRRCRAQLFSVNTCSVLLCVLKQTRVENSSPGPILSNCCN
jgi:hypothetical protein